MSTVGDAVRAHHRELMNTLAAQIEALVDDRPEADAVGLLTCLKHGLLPHETGEEQHLAEAEQDRVLEGMHEAYSEPDVRRIPPTQRHALIFQTFATSIRVGRSRWSTPTTPSHCTTSSKQSAETPSVGSTRSRGQTSGACGSGRVGRAPEPIAGPTAKRRAPPQPFPMCWFVGSSRRRKATPPATRR